MKKRKPPKPNRKSLLDRIAALEAELAIVKGWLHRQSIAYPPPMPSPPPFWDSGVRCGPVIAG